MNNMNEVTCKHCGTKLIEKATNRVPEQLQKAYYYTAYYFCPKCHRMYHDNKFKIENTLRSPLSSSGFLASRNEVIPGGDNVNDSRIFDVEIWTDGACSNNGRANAKAAWAFVTKDYEKGGLVEGKQTNNTAEALAVYHALLFAIKHSYETIRLYTD